MTDRTAYSDARRHGLALVENIEKVIVGKRPVITRAVLALLAEGHILIEDVPGIGKTMLAKAIAQSIAGRFRRIQFTADLLPSDITGVNTFRQDTGDFAFRPGPIFGNVLLGDEINRATPRTQSSLLEAMEEMQVTVAGAEHDLERPFLVIATQNPIELEGTYPLPFAQMDRFIVRIRIGYLEPAEESRMIRERLHTAPIAALKPVLDTGALAGLQTLVRTVKIEASLLDYAVAIVNRTRHADALEYGASPRGGLDLVRYSQAAALLDGRDYVLPDDIKTAAPTILAHRVIARRGTRHVTFDADALIAELVETVDVPL